MNNPRYQLEQRLEEVLAADFPEWVWTMKKGDAFGVTKYQGSWSPPGTQLIFPATFICISGKQVFYLRDGRIENTPWASDINTVEMLEKHIAEITQYREENPNWEHQGM